MAGCWTSHSTSPTWRTPAKAGFEYFYDQQWKRFFQTVPARYRLAIDGRPVVFMWHGGFEWYTRQNFFHAMIDALRQATRRDFGVDPSVIVEESWLRLDPATGVDALFDWFEPRRSFATLMNGNGVRVGHLVPGYDCSRCGGSGPVIPRQAGALYRAGLAAVAPSADLVLIEGLDNVDENGPGPTDRQPRCVIHRNRARHHGTADHPRSQRLVPDVVA